RLPQRHLELSPQLNAQVTYFNRDTRVSGTRLDVEPSISYPFIKSYAFIEPRLSIRHTEYFLNGEDDFRDRETRTLPVLSLDSRLFAERRTSIFGNRVLQTFEPRAMYLYIPKDGQDDIPVFDSGLYDINFRSLFYRNRFSGRDRIGDTNQIALAASTRILSLESGREIFRGSVGQIYYFQDREITLPGRAKNTNDLSEIVAEVAANINRAWSTRFALQWDPNDSSTRKANASVRYQPGDGTIVNAGYRQRSAVTDVEQTDISFRWPVTDELAVVGRWNFSLQNNRTLEAMGGIEYESCCWGMRLVSRRFLRNTEGEFDNAVFMQFVFKGLAGYGGSTGSFLRRSIPGYETYF
ncbi:MAG: LPS assembly protein LptD, partial [Pseudomonadota bacterium]